MPISGPVLLLRSGALGDMVQFSAVVAALADHHDQPVDVLTGSGAPAEVLAGMPEIGRVFTLSHRRRPGWLAPDLLGLARILAGRRYAHAYCFDHAPVIERALVAAGTRLAEIPDTAHERHALDSYQAALLALGVDAPTAFLPRVRATGAERDAARELVRANGLGRAGRGLLVVQPGNKRSLHPLRGLRPSRDLKAWPAERWAATIVALAEDLDVVLAGAPAEWTFNEDIRRRLPADICVHTANLARDLPVRVLAGLLAEAAGCIAVDTGPAHLAAALGCPTVVLFGPADPAAMVPRGPAPVAVVRSAVECSPCYGTARRDACRDNICMQRIPVAAVVAAWRSLGIHAAVCA